MNSKSSRLFKRKTKKNSRPHLKKNLSVIKDTRRSKLSPQLSTIRSMSKETKLDLRPTISSNKRRVFKNHRILAMKVPLLIGHEMMDLNHQRKNTSRIRHTTLKQEFSKVLSFGEKTHSEATQSGNTRWCSQKHFKQSKVAQ